MFENNIVKRRGRSKKYNVGDVFNTVQSFGVVPVSQKGDAIPTVGFQLSFKKDKSVSRGFRILPAGTPMTYVGVRFVRKTESENVGTQKMIFKILQDTVFEDGTVNDADFEVAGAVSYFSSKQASENIETLVA